MFRLVLFSLKHIFSLSLTYCSFGHPINFVDFTNLLVYSFEILSNYYLDQLIEDYFHLRFNWKLHIDPTIIHFGLDSTSHLHVRPLYRWIENCQTCFWFGYKIVSWSFGWASIKSLPPHDTMMILTSPHSSYRRLENRKTSHLIYSNFIGFVGCYSSWGRNVKCLLLNI